MTCMDLVMLLRSNTGFSRQIWGMVRFGFIMRQACMQSSQKGSSSLYLRYEIQEAVQPQAPAGIRPGAGSCARIESAPGLCFRTVLPRLTQQVRKADWTVTLSLQHFQSLVYETGQWNTLWVNTELLAGTIHQPDRLPPIWLIGLEWQVISGSFRK